MKNRQVQTITSETPYGAQASDGIVFQIPLARMARWPEMLRQKREHQRQRETLQRLYCR